VQSVNLLAGLAVVAVILFFFNDTATTEIYTLSLHDALPISAAFSVGALVGALAARKLRESSEAPSLVWCSLITALAVAAVSVLPWFGAVLAVLAIGGTADGVVDVAYLGVIQRRSPDAVRSRVIGAFEGLSMLAIAGSFTFAGFIVDGLGAKGSYAFAGGLALLTPVLLAVGFRRARTAAVVEEA